MDPERQPLLGHTDFRCRRLRPLTHEEVLEARDEVSWRRARFCILFLFWCIMAMSLSIVTCILVTASKCRSYDEDMSLLPSVPPVHMSLAPLAASGRAVYNDGAFTV
ncbi:hypothetical protein evm_001536 [Chilo suppressalis]|nr:hypothetical protein evm_001536 [Chilo suppressalis]